MRFIKKLLDKRGLDKVPLPLWKLKLTEEEYQELRDLLKHSSQMVNGQLPFGDLQEECTLFFAEFWRREYKNGAHSIAMVYEALHSSRDCYADLFYSMACCGAKKLKIEVYQGWKSNMLDSMLYQGGLPMQLVTQSGREGKWANFLRGLVFRHIDFSQLDIGKTAQTNKGLKQFCEQLIDAADKQQYLLMPFYCENEFNPWYQFLILRTGYERRKVRAIRPFSIKWVIELDEIEKKISCKYFVHGPQKVKEEFMRQNELSSDFFSLDVRVNDRIQDTFDFTNGFCRYDVRSVHPYKNGDIIDIYLENREVPYLSDILDLSVPHMLYQNKDGRYELGNQLGKKKSLLLLNDDWEIKDAKGFRVETFRWGEDKYTAVLFDTDFEGSITVSSKDGDITFSEDVDLMWTEIVSHPLQVPQVVEQLYNAERTRFARCYNDYENNVCRHQCNVLFRSKWNDKWSSEAPYGKIVVRATDANGTYITPINFINVGAEFSIESIESDKETCRIRILWPYGQVACVEGRKDEDDIWTVNKEDCINDPHHIHFIFTPKEDSKNAFTLTIRAPFKDFSIFDSNGNNIDDDIYIPFADVDKYRYHCVGQDVEYTFDNQKKYLWWINGKLNIVGEGEQKEIPSEGSLLQLFYSRVYLKNLLDHTAKDITHASIPVRFQYGDDKTLCFEIKESPYRIKQDGDTLTVIDKDWKPYHYEGTLKLLKIDEPNHDTVTIHYDPDKGYVLPDEIKDWGKTMVLGRSRGRLLPTLVEPEKELTQEERKANFLDTRERMKQELREGKLGDNVWKQIANWFKRIESDDICASSVINLWALGQDANALIFFAFMEYAITNEDEREQLQRQLLTLGRDLAFKWYWIMPIMSGQTMAIINNYFGDNSIYTPSFQAIYAKWAYAKWSNIDAEKTMTYLSAINKSEEFFAKAIECLKELTAAFESWMKDLFVLSLEGERTITHSEGIMTIIRNMVGNGANALLRFDCVHFDIPISQDDIDLTPNSIEFFRQFNNTHYNDNETWLLTRVKAVAAHWKNKGKNGKNLFEKDDEVRRSIIYCMDVCHDDFILALNNELAEA